MVTVYFDKWLSQRRPGSPRKPVKICTFQTHYIAGKRTSRKTETEKIIFFEVLF